MIKAILFDVGGVYLEGSFVDFVNKSRRVLGINEEFFSNKEVIFDVRLNKGEITTEECFKRYFRVQVSNEDMKKLIKLWTNTWILSSEMRKLVIKLKKNYKLAILSNSDLLNSQNYTKKGWYKYFDALILSHEVGILKPQKKIYEIAVEKLNIKPQECLLIDDQKDCLRTAKEMGMAIILFKSIPQLEKELQRKDIKF